LVLGTWIDEIDNTVNEKKAAMDDIMMKQIMTMLIIMIVLGNYLLHRRCIRIESNYDTNSKDYR
jgi:hypothetical protein